LNEKFDNKLKIFAMDEIIKEVLEYINPKEKAEAVDNKGKKGKTATKEEVHDIYEGKDTATYKEIG
jgi:hypothetical protein